MSLINMFKRVFSTPIETTSPNPSEVEEKDDIKSRGTLKFKIKEFSELLAVRLGDSDFREQVTRGKIAKYKADSAYNYPKRFQKGILQKLNKNFDMGYYIDSLSEKELQDFTNVIDTLNIDILIEYFQGNISVGDFLLKLNILQYNNELLYDTCTTTVNKQLNSSINKELLDRVIDPLEDMVMSSDESLVKFVERMYMQNKELATNIKWLFRDLGITINELKQLNKDSCVGFLKVIEIPLENEMKPLAFDTCTVNECKLTLGGYLRKIKSTNKEPSTFREELKYDRVALLIRSTLDKLNSYDTKNFYFVKDLLEDIPSIDERDKLTEELHYFKIN